MKGVGAARKLVPPVVEDSVKRQKQGRGRREEGGVVGRPFWSRALLRWGRRRDRGEAQLLVPRVAEMDGMRRDSGEHGCSCREM